APFFGYQADDGDVCEVCEVGEVSEVAEVAEVADFDKSEFNPSDSDRKIWTGIRKLISFFKK
nr:hypothetical protein [Escherichia coli]